MTIIAIVVVLILLFLGVAKAAASIKIERRKTSIEQTSEKFNNYRKR